MTNWIKITVNVSRETQEQVSALLLMIGASGLEIEDSQDYLDYEAKNGELLPEVYQSEDIKISSYYPEEEVNPEFLSDLKSQLTEIADFDLTIDELEEENWANAWKKYFYPSRISRYLTIVPSWTDYKSKNPDEKLIRLDPGMAFGTGTHPTTKLSIYALEQILTGGERVLDVGTGSAVLSIVSSFLGAKEIYAYDIDNVAVAVAKENIALNEKVKNIEVTANNLLEGIDIKADVIVANILAEVLLLMLEDAYRLLKEEGYLILSGIISHKKQELLEQAVSLGFKLETQMQQGDWHCLVLKKHDEELFFG
ncbi:MAG: 50S ribosomal protein L11 methyltransferase [Lactovum sp.]